jgi:hypothetical protein
MPWNVVAKKSGDLAILAGLFVVDRFVKDPDPVKLKHV